jgi:hypothetical protein
MQQEEILSVPRSPIRNAEEELPMTVQVAMVGTDGIVLAGDTRHSIKPRFEGAAARYGYGSTKIRIDDEGKIAVCCAMDMVAAKRFADRILSELINEGPTTNRERRIKEIGIEVADGLCGGRDIECLIAFADSLTTFYRFRFMGADREASVDQIFDAAPAGDTVNSAIFWRMRYYTRLPISQLIVLASHLVVSAGELNTAMIDGLEIVLCDSNGFRRLSQDENREWADRAIERGKRIGDLVLGL